MLVVGSASTGGEIGSITREDIKAACGLDPTAIVVITPNTSRLVGSGIFRVKDGEPKVGFSLPNCVLYTGQGWDCE